MASIAPNCSRVADVKTLPPPKSPAEWVAAAALPMGGVVALAAPPVGWGAASLVTFSSDGRLSGQVAIEVPASAGCVWSALTVSNSNGTLVAARECTGHSLATPTVFELRRDGSVLARLNVSIGGQSDWAGVAAAGIEGDGREQIFLVRLAVGGGPPVESRAPTHSLSMEDPYRNIQGGASMASPPLG